jgi:hypothetical protein
VVDVGGDRPALASYLGAEYTSRNELNGYILVKYGGTRFPVPPPGVDPFVRTVDASRRAEVRQTYLDAYAEVFGRVKARFDVQPPALICNQMSTSLIADLPGVADAERAVVTGHDSGHLGPADTVVALRRLLDEGPLESPVLVGASTPYAFGAAVMAPS